MTKDSYYFKLFEFHTDSGLGVQLTLPEVRQAEALFRGFDGSRQEMGRWLPWVKQMKNPLDEVAHIKNVQQAMVRGGFFGLTIVVENSPAGMIDLHDFKKGGGQIGYWLTPRFQGRGIVSKSTTLICRYAFKVLNWDYLDLLTLPDNVKSQRVARRCGFSYMGSAKGYKVFRKIKAKK